MLQIFLPILENRELLATKSMTICYSEQNRPDKSLCVNVPLVDITGMKITVIKAKLHMCKQQKIFSAAAQFGYRHLNKVEKKTGAVIFSGGVVRTSPIPPLKIRARRVILLHMLLFT